MPDPKTFDPRAELVATLLEKVEQDQYPSATMLDMLEEILRPEEVPAYADVLLRRIRSERFPSTSMLYRLQNLT